MKRHFNRWLVLLSAVLPLVVLFACGVKDSTIQQSVDATLKNNADLAAVSATVKDGVVTLTGESKTDSSKSAVESDLAKLKGVKQVVNNITVAPPPPPPAPVAISADDQLTKMVADVTKDYPGVKAEVKDGVITLTGKIRRANLQKLMTSLHALKPKKIDNQLKIG